MNIYDAILRDMPYAAYAFTNSATTYSSIDASGVVMTATPAGLLNNQSMCVGATKSILLANGAELKVPFPSRFSSENTNSPFSLEAIVGISAPNAFTIAGHKGQADGLVFDGDFIRFTANFQGSITVSAAWSVPDMTKNYHVVGTYDHSRLALYIDGNLVSEAVVPDGAVLVSQTDKNIYSIATNPASFRIEAPAYYHYQLTASMVNNHYRLSRRVPSANDIVTRAGGTLWTFSDSERQVQYSELVDWNFGLSNNVDTSAGQLKPNYDINSGLSIAGTYVFSVPIADPENSATVNGMKVEWNGDGNFSTEYSVDNGTTWSTLVNGTVPANTISMAGTVTPLIRITFTAGRVANLDVVRDMRVTTYATPKIYSPSSSERTFTVTGTPTTSTFWREPIEDDSSSGLVLGSSINYVTLDESTGDNINNIGAVEMWVSFDQIVSGSYVFDSRGVTPSNASYMWLNGTSQLAWSGVTVYVDGTVRTSGSIVPVAGRLYHIVATYATPHNAKIRFGPGATTRHNIRMMGTYPTTLTAAQILALYKSYTEMPTLTISDTNPIVLSEYVTQTKAYVNDWSIQGAG